MDAYAAFRNRDFPFLIGGVSLANMALQMLSVAVSWDLYSKTHSAVVLGNVGLAQVAPALLFTLFAGQAADRFERRRMMILTQLACVAASLLPLVAGQSVAALYLCLFLATTARTFQWPVRGTLLPRLVPPEQLTNAITWNTSFMEIANVSGPALAGIIIAAFGVRAVYATQAIFALASAASYMAIRFRASGSEGRTASATGLLDGLRFLIKTPLIISAVSLDLFAVLFGGAVALLPIFAVEILKGDSHTLGWLRAAPSLGAVTMALTQAHRPRFKKPGHTLLATIVGFGVATIIFGLSRNLWLSLAALFLTGMFDNISVVLRQHLLQTRTPYEVRGRVLAATSIFISCSNQIGAVESGWAAHWLGTVPSVVAGGIATIVVVAICAAVSPAIRNWREA